MKMNWTLFGNAQFVVGMVLTTLGIAQLGYAMVYMPTVYGYSTEAWVEILKSAVTGVIIVLGGLFSFVSGILAHSLASEKVK